jgi:hypothetical protein
MRKRWILLGYGVILLWMLWPLLSILVAGGIASAGNCQLDEGSVHPCVVLGRDLGETLYTLFVLGWFSLITLPTGGIALAVFTVVVLVLVSRARRRRTAASPAAAP